VPGALLKSQNGETAQKAQAGADRAAFIERLQTILTHWPSADRLARVTGVSPSAFRKWLRGEAEPSRERLVALANASGVPVGWLANGDGPEPRFQGATGTARSRGTAAHLDADLGLQNYVVLPKRPEAAAAGAESPPVPSTTEFIAFRHDWVRGHLGIEPDQLVVETALGESMEPTIQNGDLLLVDTTESHLHSFGVYVIEIAGERLVKRMQPRLDGSLTVISDNPAYEAEHLPPDWADTVRIVGRVLWTCGPTRSGR
jgi:phage repressor protein C with HTH and peptisase S24 domain